MAGKRQEWNKGADKKRFEIDSRSLYEHLEYNLAEYFVRIRDLVCAHVPASARDLCPAANCSIMLKMFPVYVDADTVIDHTPSPGHAACQDARNVLAMKAWKDALHSFEQVCDMNMLIAELIAPEDSIAVMTS